MPQLVTFNKTLIIRSEPLALGPLPSNGQTNLQFAFGDPNLSENKSAVVSNWSSALPFTIESYYFQIPQIPSINFSRVERSIMGIGTVREFDESFEGGILTFPITLKNAFWETKLDLGLVFSETEKKVLYFPNHDVFTVDLLSENNSIPASAHNTNIYLELLFNVRSQDRVN